MRFETNRRSPRNQLLLVGLSLGGLLLSLGCVSRGRSGGPSGVPRGGDGAVADGEVAADPSCWDPGSIVPDITCGSARPDVVCPGSCGQTLEGIVGVGLSRCRCMDNGSGFGPQWICDVSGCETSGADGGTVTGTDGGAPIASDGGADAAAACPPVRYSEPTTPGCNFDQLDEFTRIASQADYDAFAANPANATCNNCITLATLACATSAGCAQPAGDLNCCFDARCATDDMPCREAAVRGECAAAAATVDACVSAIPGCGLNPATPPAACFP